MKFNHPARIFFLLLPLLLSSGCTNLLWQNTDWDCRPASQTNLQVYNAAQKQDLLVIYDEVSDRTLAVHTRAYWLHQNQQRVVAQKRPHFVNPNLASQLAAVPIFQAPPTGTNAPGPLYIVAPKFDLTFTVYANQMADGTYGLPFYKDRVGQAERFFFSPVAITVDAALVGTVIYFGLQSCNCP